jgi:hypothetical protein
MIGSTRLRENIGREKAHQIDVSKSCVSQPKENHVDCRFTKLAYPIHRVNKIITLHVPNKRGISDIITPMSATHVKTSSLQPKNQNKLGLVKNAARVCSFHVNLFISEEKPAALQAGTNP